MTPPVRNPRKLAPQKLPESIISTVPGYFQHLIHDTKLKMVLVQDKGFINVGKITFDMKFIQGATKSDFSLHFSVNP